MQLRKQNVPPQGPVRYWMKDAAGSSSGRLGLVASGLAVVAALEHRRRHQASILADLLFDLRGDLRVLLEEGLGVLAALADALAVVRSEEHTSELQSLMRISDAVFCLKKK